MNTLDVMAQADAFVFGILAILLISRKNKWGFVCGLFGQPGFLVTTIVHKQWGIFALSIAYTISWAYGFYQWFLKKEDSPLS